ncbi:MAG: hypothetical protein GXY83_22905 [Rhodopirellula sp.]|nr:hypothetical protein [Rhodopirellula sp.]
MPIDWFTVAAQVVNFLILVWLLKRFLYKPILHAIARKTLTDLAGTSLEERMSDVFAGRLRELDREAREDLANALKTRSEPVLVRSAFELPPEQRAAINDALGETFSADIQVRFETAPDVISGVELIASGRKVAWSIADYLASLEESVGELLKEQSSPAVKAEATPEARAEFRPESETEGAVPEEAQ